VADTAENTIDNKDSVDNLKHAATEQIDGASQNAGNLK
jgi:hypothetical protein